MPCGLSITGVTIRVLLLLLTALGDFKRAFAYWSKVLTPKHGDVILFVQHPFELLGRHLLDDGFRVVLRGPVRGGWRVRRCSRGPGARQVFLGGHVLLDRDRGKREHGEQAAPRDGDTDHGTRFGREVRGQAIDRPGQRTEDEEITIDSILLVTRTRVAAAAVTAADERRRELLRSWCLGFFFFL